ncbi:XopAG/AvrGf1 family type III secretion system effector [Bradyrhizobium sp. 31Argb]|uniref:XopAG/AvrGf1 family type III secretion system effector n=1 Tax=Bradyrhizobium sp. 31Argb TaxID=3141247 RepID=UPI00374A96DD
MRITNSQSGMVLQTAQRTDIISPQSLLVTPHRAKANTNAPTNFPASRQIASGSRESNQSSTSSGGEEARGSGNLLGFARRVMKYAFGMAGAAYLYNKAANDFFLSTTSLHDGKGGFSSDTRLIKAQKQAEKYYQVHCALTDEEKAHIGNQIKASGIVGSNHFASMVDYRAATKVHIKNLVNTEQAHDSIMKNIKCLVGREMTFEGISKHAPTMVPESLDLTSSPQYLRKNKYSLSGVKNEETGSTGYASRTITRPFIERGLNDFIEKVESERSLSPKEAVEALEAHLNGDRRLCDDAQLVAGQAFLTFSRVYENNWGSAHKVLMPYLHEKGWLSLAENKKMGMTRPFAREDMEMGLLRRNTSVMGPFFHDASVHLHRALSGMGLVPSKDFSHREVREMRYLPISHFKLNDVGNGFEDCSGLSDSFTSFNVAVCINHARMMNGEERLSKDDVVALVGCLNAVFDNASGVRHTLQENARGCFAGAGYATEDGDDFYRNVCKNASDEFYCGKARYRNGHL